MIKNLKPSGKFKSGKFKPKNPWKYKGDLSKIIYRSKLELDFMKKLDNDIKVKAWVSEPPKYMVRYLSPKDGKYHRYFIDFYVEKEVNGSIQKFLVEVKPSSHVKKPVPPKPSLDIVVNRKRQARYRAKKLAHAIIHAKRKACQEMATKNHMKFIFITEKFINKN